jgi:argininosuccinate lyase
MKLWSGRFNKEADKLLEEFTASIHFDKLLWEDDIIGSLAHVNALGKANILSQTEVKTICDGLQKLTAKIAAGEVEFKIADEDIHMNIERLLFQEIGDLAGKMHTGRSRNDQVALDLHLYLRRQVLVIIENICNLQKILLEQAAKHIDTIFPGYTHLQRAVPVRLAHHLLAYVAMFGRDIDRLISSWPRINCSPLGAGALAGNSFNIDVDYIANILGFEGFYDNSIDAVSDRDFIAEFLANTAIIMMHLSRLCEEIILWSSQEFAFIELDDAFCTGSSIMPQKKNPDVAELIRGKTGRTYGALISLLTTLKALPLAYNKDMQEDKEGLFDTIKTVSSALIIMVPLLSTMKVNLDHIAFCFKNDLICATELANYLVKKGMPFRDAHKTIGKLVSYCVNQNLQLREVNLTTLKNLSSLFADDVYELLNPEVIIELQQSKNGTAKKSVIYQMKNLQNKLDQAIAWKNKKNNNINLIMHKD